MELKTATDLPTALSCPFTRGLTVTQGGGLLNLPALFVLTTFHLF